MSWTPPPDLAPKVYELLTHDVRAARPWRDLSTAERAAIQSTVDALVTTVSPLVTPPTMPPAHE